MRRREVGADWIPMSPISLHLGILPPLFILLPLLYLCHTATPLLSFLYSLYHLYSLYSLTSQSKCPPLFTPFHYYSPHFLPFFHLTLHYFLFIPIAISNLVNNILLPIKSNLLVITSSLPIFNSATSICSLRLLRLEQMDQLILSIMP